MRNVSLLIVMLCMSVALSAQLPCPNPAPLTCGENTILLSEDWESDNTLGWTGDLGGTTSGQGNNSNGLWNIDNNGTGSSRTGPLVGNLCDEGAGSYVYFEASGPTVPEALLNFPEPYDLTDVDQGELSFYWHAAGDPGEGFFDLEASIDGGATWVSIFNLDSGDTPMQSDPFTLETIDLSNFVGETVLFRFNVRNTSFTADFAFDNIQIQVCTEIPAPIPTLGEWSIILLSILLLIIGLTYIRIRQYGMNL